MFREDGPQSQAGNGKPLEQLVEPLYGRALRQQMGWPEWFLESQAILQDRWKIKREGQVAVARSIKPEELDSAYQTVYSRLSPILMLDTASFIQAVPQVLTYRNGHLDSYIGRLRQIFQIIYKKFGYRLPVELNWAKNPTLYSIENLNLLEAKAKTYGELQPSERDQLKKELSAFRDKRIFVIGARTPHQRDTIVEYLPKSAIVRFHSGEDNGINTEDFGGCDVIVLTGGVGVRDITEKLKATYGDRFNAVKIDAYKAVNPERVLSIMARNAYRF